VSLFRRSRRINSVTIAKIGWRRLRFECDACAYMFTVTGRSLWPQALQAARYHAFDTCPALRRQGTGR
jgi:hypothetical protein